MAALAIDRMSQPEFGNPSHRSRKQFADLTDDDIRDALSYIDPSNRWDWFRMAMVVWLELGEAGFDIWNEWSKGASDGYDERSARQQWRSARKVRNVNVGTLIYLASLEGWKLDTRNRVPLSQAELDDRKVQRKARAEEARAAAKAAEGAAAKIANEIWSAAEPVEGDAHAYLQRKGVQSHGLRLGKWPMFDKTSGEIRKWIAGALLVPMTSRNGKITSLQAIFGEPPAGWSTDKSYLRDGAKTGSFHMLGQPKPGQSIALCEGYATGASIHEASGWCVVVTFDAGNLPAVAEALSEAMPGHTFIVAADNDRWTSSNGRGNPGVYWATEAGKVLNARVVVPEFKNLDGRPTDFNDLHQREGAEAVMRQLIPQPPIAANDLMPAAANDSTGTALLDIDPKDLSEDVLAQVFEHRHADTLRFCHTAGAWYHWNGIRWSNEQTMLAFALARQICRDFGKGQPKLGKAATASAVERFAMSARSLAVTSELWDAAPWLIGTPGGTLDLRSGEMHTARPDEHITRLCGCAPATESAVPRRWLAFLDDATRGDASLIRFLRQVAGYALTGVTTEHAMFFIYGAGGNGKSVFLNTLAGILADYARTAPMDTFTASAHDKHPTDLAMLKGARLVSASETEDGRAWAEAKIKQMTGGDPITARFMRRDFFTYTPEFKLVIVGNHKPRLNNVDEATRRRLNIIPFVHKPTAPDPDLERTLRDEWPAILRWMVDGCLDWQANGLVRPSVVIEATREYFEDQDVFGQWLDECCEMGPRHKEANQLLFASWKRYAEAAGEHAGSTKAFSEAMRKRGLTPYKSGGSRGFTGVRLQPVAADSAGRFSKEWD